MTSDPNQSNTFSQNIDGNGKGNQVAHNTGHVGDVIYNGNPDSPTAEIFEPILQSLQDKEWGEDTPEEIKLKFANPMAMMKSAQKTADAEIAAGGDQNKERFEQKKAAWFEWIKQVTPMFASGAVKVGLAVLDKYADQSPTIAGLKMALNLVNEANDEKPNKQEPKQHAVPMKEVPPKPLPE